jgi:hypothetical protein
VASLPSVIALLRFDSADDGLQGQLEELLDLLAAKPGFVRGRLGRATDDQAAWVLATEWDGAGTYRRALSSYEVKLLAPLLGQARPEASAFEVVTARP